MSKQHIRAWQDLLQRLSDLKDNVHDSKEWLRHRQLVRAAHKLVEGLLAPMPRAVLKKFVLEAQIPRRLVAAGIALPADVPPDRASFLRLIHVHTLRHLLQRVTAAGLLGSSSSSSSSLAATFKQQLFQEGLFRFIAACMTDKAEHLQAAAVLRGSSLPRPADFSADMHISQQDFSTSDVNHASCLLQLHHRLHTQLRTAQQVQESLKNFAALATPAACHLTMASLQFIAATQHPVQQQLLLHKEPETTQQQQQQQGSAAAGEPDENLATLLQWCCLCMPIVSAMASSTWDPELMQGFYLIPWMAAAWLVHSYASLMQQHTLLPAAQAYRSCSSTSSSSMGKSSRPVAAARSSSSSSRPVLQGRTGITRDETLACWREAARQLDRLPAAHSELAALLGTDLRTIVWAAATVVKIKISAEELSLFLVQCTTPLIRQAPSPLRSSLPGLYELLPAVLLYWAAHQQGGVDDSGVHQAVLGSIAALHVWCYLSNTEQPQDDAAAAVGVAPQGLGDLPSLHPCMIEEGLPLVLLLLARLQQQQPATPSVVGGTAAAESTGTQGDQQCSTAAHAIKPLPPAVGMQVPGVELLWYLCAYSPGGTKAAACTSPAAGRAAAEAPAAAAAALPAAAEAAATAEAAAAAIEVAAAGDASAAHAHADPAQQHCTSVIKVLEAFVRANAQEGICTSKTLLRLGLLFPDDPGMAERSLRCLPALAAASGSEAQQQLLGLVRSLLKLSATGHQRDRHTALLCADVCAGAVCLFISCLAADPAAEGPAAGSHGSSSSMTCCSSSKLPWLHVLGHCFMQCSVEQQRIGAEAEGVTTFTNHNLYRPAWCLDVSAATATAAVCASTQPGLSSALQQQSEAGAEEQQQQQQQTAVVTPMQGPLPANSTLQSTDVGATDRLLTVREALRQESAAIAAMGLDNGSILQTLDALQAAITAYKNFGKHDTATNTELAEQWQAAGVALTAVAVPHCCNNPSCSNVSGPAELQLVSGRSCICAGCQTARYCGRPCQRSHWKQHKPVCKAIATAAAAVACGNTSSDG